MFHKMKVSILDATRVSVSLVLGVAVFVTLLLVSCSPVSENLVKKAHSVQHIEGRGSMDISDAQSLASSLSEVDRLTIKSYGGLVRKYSGQYGLDWRLILSVMKAESRFSENVKSHKGAAGLMQIMPVTSEEVARILDIEDMAHPKNNIHGGIYYLHKLYNLFEGAEESERIKLTLAAYNAGIGRIYDAQVLAAYLQDDPRKWDAIKEALPLLSKRYYTLHKNVWDQGRPKIAGWFGNSKETITYVDRVMDYYEGYKSSLN